MEAAFARLYAFLIVIAALWAMPRKARAQLYVSHVDRKTQSGLVSEYDPSTGAVIKADFITGPAGGLAVSGNTLFVTNAFFNTIGKYNAATGAVIKADFIRGLGIPRNLALSGNTLFVVNGGGTVGKYDATTGGAINAGFITGLYYPDGIAVKSPK